MARTFFLYRAPRRQSSFRRATSAFESVFRIRRAILEAFAELGLRPMKLGERSGLPFSLDRPLKRTVSSASPRMSVVLANKMRERAGHRENGFRRW
jgi:hypothetical protein